MMRRVSGGAVVAAVLWAYGLGATAEAQFGGYYYPGGYGGWGWGGWGANTVQGSVAQGMGVFAAGAGVYNQQTAVANSINADTVMRWNQYWYEAQVNANRNQRARMDRRAAANKQALAEIETRLKENPDVRDIHTGNALNMALQQINDPRVYTKALADAKVKIGGELIRDIPFQYAAAAISTSVHQLTSGGPPALLRQPQFEADRTALRALADKVRRLTDEGGEPDPADLKAIQEKLISVRETFEKTVKRDTPGYAEADRFLKAAYGLARMLETPAINILLSGVEKRPEATVGELLNFMSAFNLRFGAATSPRQRTIYETLWPILDKLRDEAVAAVADAGNPSGATAASTAPPSEFFAGMAHEDIKKKPATPAPPEPK